MGRKKLTTEEREKRKEEVINKMRKLFDMVGDINSMTTSVGLKEKIVNKISIGVFTLKPTRIVEYVNQRFEVNIGVRSRKQNIVFARQVCMHLLRKFTRLSLKEIAEYAGVTDHATVMHGLKRLDCLMETEESTRLIVEGCENDVYQHFKSQLSK
jgi:chromosomal replication initiation ATPase DnaA